LVGVLILLAAASPTAPIPLFDAKKSLSLVEAVEQCR